MSSSKSLVWAVLTVLGIAFVSTFTAEAQPVVFVDPNASGANDGSSWSDAYRSLQTALANTGSGAIWVRAGIYQPDEGSGNRGASYQLKNGVTLYGGFAGTEDPATFDLDLRDFVLNETALSGNIGLPDTSGDNSYHVVTGSGCDTTAILDGFTVTSGNANGTDPNDDGGGIYINNGSPLIRKCLIVSNTAAGNGAGLCDSGTSNPRLALCTFEGNAATGLGGAVYHAAGTLVANNSILAANTASQGGGIYLAGNVTLESTTLCGNAATGSGGGITGSGSGTVYLVQATVSGNSAGANGGGLRAPAGTWIVRQSTIAENRATSSGGGVHREGGTVTVTNTLIGFNSAGNGPDVSGAFASPGSQYNLIRVLDGSSGLSEPNSITGTLAAPCNPRIALLGNSGGATPAHALLPDSPAVDQGNNALALDASGQTLTTDQRGLPRYSGNGTVDIGAVEGAVVTELRFIGPPPPSVVYLGHITPITWDQTTLPAGSVLRVYYDPDTQLSGNENWIDVDIYPDTANGSYPWAPVLVPPGTYYIGGRVFDPYDETELDDRLDTPFTVEDQADYVVDSLLDVVANDGHITLREALLAANTNTNQGDAPGGSSVNVDIIVFDPSLTGQTIELTNGDLPVTDSTWIRGPGSVNLTVDANSLGRIFDISAASDKRVWITGLTLQDGSKGANGGGIYATVPLVMEDVTIYSCLASSSASGGGVYCSAPLTIRDSLIAENSVSGNGNGGGLCCASTLTISGSVVSGNSLNSGSNGQGAGISCAGALAMSDTTVSGNTNNLYNSSYGGGVSCGAGSITTSTISGNYALVYGGGLYHGSGVLSIVDTDITGNWTPSSTDRLGGGVQNAGGTLLLTRVELASNSAGNGGGLYNAATATATIRDSNIVSNTASGGYGGVYNNGGTLTIENTTVAANTAPSVGGVGGSGTVTLIQSTVSGNRATTGTAGGLYASSGTWIVRQATVAGNHAGTEGGGIYRAGGTVTLSNTIVSNNTAATLGQDLRGSFDPNSVYNLVRIVDDSTGIDPDPAKHNLTGTLALPLAAWVGMLADNGGLLVTHHLLTGSPASEAGLDVLAVDSLGQPLTTDQRGAGYPRILGGAVDIGAVEGALPVEFELTGTLPPTVAIGSVLPIDWTQGTIPLGQATLSLYADVDDAVNGNEFWILRDANPDDLVAGYNWTVIGLADLTAHYRLGAILRLATGEEYHSRLAATFQVVYGGTVYLVTSLGDVVANDGWLTLREAVQAASLNIPQADAPAGSSVQMDVIRFDPDLSGGWIELSGFELEVLEGVFIEGPGATLLTIDGNDLTRIFNISGGTADYVWLRGLELVEGYSGSAYGGGISSSSNLVLDDVTVSSCRTSSSYSGGGVYCSAPLTIRDSLIAENSVSGNGNGGGLCCASTLTISGSVVSGNSLNSGSNGQGAGISCAGALAMSDTTVSGNTNNLYNSSYGGGVSCGAGSITTSTISGNYALVYGGGLYHGSGVLSIVDTDITGNWTPSSTDRLGGGVQNAGGTLLLTRVELASNSAGNGGGLYNAATATATIRDSNIVSNTASGGYGGVYNNGGTLTIENTTVAANTAPSAGGVGGSGTVTLIQSTVSGNRATTGTAGGLYASSGTWTVRQATICNNQAATEGGGVYRAGGTVTVYNTIVAGNTAGTLGQDVRGAFSTNSHHNLVGICNDSIGLCDDPHTPGGTLTAPLDPKLGTLADNGGLLVTHHLLTGSPASEAGLDVLAVDSLGQPLTTDQRGAGYPRILGGAVDIGAVEGALPVEFELTGTLPPTVAIGSVLPIDWTQGMIPLGQATLSLYADVDDAVNGNEFWILRDANPDDLVAGYNWTVIGLADLTAHYRLGAILRLATGEEYHSRLAATFQVVYGGTVYLVTSLGDVVANDGWLTLREAVQAASLNIPQADAPAGSSVQMDVIRFDPDLSGGWIELSGFELEVLEGVFIEGPGATLLTIDGNDLTRIFNISGGTADYVWLRGLELVEGYSGSAYGGGISSSSNLVLDDVTVSSCRTSSSYSGGGVYCSAPLTIRDSLIAENSVSGNGNGGGLCCASTLTISGSVVSGNSLNSGSNGQGAGISCAGALAMSDTTVSGNTNNLYNSSYGGGVSCGAGSITTSTISGNYDLVYGGGLYHGSGVLSIVDTDITGNWTYSSSDRLGGGVYNAGGTLLLTRVELASNSTGSGGGLYNAATATATLRDSNIVSNTASGGYGGVYNNGGTLTIENTTVAANTAPSAGGVGGSGTVTLIQSTVSGNRATTGTAGGLYASSGTWTVRQATIYNNQAATEGGGINNTGTVTLYNTIVAGNTAAVGRDVRGAFSVVSACNLIGIIDGSTGLGVDPCTQAGTLSSPLAPGLDSLALHGGFTSTHALQPSSPAIDHGSDEYAVDASGQPLAYDQCGAPFERVAGLSVDVGAREYLVDPNDNTPPVIGMLTASAALVYIGDPLTLTASGVTDAAPGTVVSVAFYRDADHNGQGTSEELLGTATSGSGGTWTWATTATWAPGLQTFLAVATDDGAPTGTPLQSAPASATAMVLDLAPPQIIVGDTAVLANHENQPVPIYVTGLDRVRGFNFVAELGNGGATGTEPVFSAVDFTGGIWDGHAVTTAGGPVTGSLMHLDAGIVLNNAGDEVQANGLLMTLVIDTRGFSAGATYDLRLTAQVDPDPRFHVTPQFVLHGGQALTPVVLNGSIQVYETTVVGRYIFYNDSAFDGYDPAANAADDAAIATDKAALLPGQLATFSNYTSFDKGINGIMLDVRGLSTDPTLDDFEFHMGNTASPSAWDVAPDPMGPPLRRVGAGTAGSDRITLTWAEGAITKQWLAVRFMAGNTGLAADDVFYVGNAMGECGNAATNAYVDGSDVAGARDNFSNVSPVPATSRYDYDRTRYVNVFDMNLPTENSTNYLTALRLITPPASRGEGAPAEARRSPRPARDVTPLIVVDVGTHALAAGQSGQRVELFVSSLDPNAPVVSGFNLRAQIGDGDGPEAEPVFEAVDFTGGIWDAFDMVTLGGVIAGHAQHVQASVLFAETEQFVAADGLLLTLIIDTSGFESGSQFELRLAATDIGQNSDFILWADETVEPTIVNGLIDVVPPFCRGDLNCDGSVGFSDINPFVLFLLDFSAWQATNPGCPAGNGDVNGDGLFPDFGDINSFVSLLLGQPLPIECP